MLSRPPLVSGCHAREKNGNVQVRENHSSKICWGRSDGRPDGWWSSVLLQGKHLVAMVRELVYDCMYYIIINNIIIIIIFFLLILLFLSCTRLSVRLGFTVDYQVLNQPVSALKLDIKCWTLRPRLMQRERKNGWEEGKDLSISGSLIVSRNKRTFLHESLTWKSYFFYTMFIFINVGLPLTVKQPTS